MIQVGQVLDKYELLERVGQGGMAVVYRGLDRSLKRVVAVKVLHKHLSDYQEARDRFEREAQAVAKLRHENILEIFDYSGAATAEELGSSYIVTEFIDGRTLKQVVTDRPITFPEIGAMVILQVCRALQHAHAAGILHRDVKPENIMVRSDGVVKLMDFGISHMVDLERLTVTGQLLGSPAYMAPEHVEGRQLDFRTDVFAVGIVLYQMTVGKLPFEGKNPHEVLKRIAECKFVDPRQANPQIGNRLGRIILRAMAAQPDDRFSAIGEMTVALEGYLEESGIAADKVVGELGRYFQAPVAYEQAFETRLVEHLTQRGQKLLNEDNRSAALDVFDRVLTIDPENAKVIAILDGINRRRRLRGLLAGVGLGGLIIAGAVAIKMRPPASDPSPDPERIDNAQITFPSFGVRAWELDAGVDAAQVAVVEPDALPDATNGSATQPTISDVQIASDLVVTVVPSNSEIEFGDGAGFQKLDATGHAHHTVTGEMKVTARNPCCDPEPRIVKPGQTELTIELSYRPGRLIPKCAWPGVDVMISDDIGAPERLGTLNQVNFIFYKGDAVSTKTATVTFTSKENSITKRAQVPPNQTVEVSCSEP